jgi:hypothetical protein
VPQSAAPIDTIAKLAALVGRQRLEGNEVRSVSIDLLIPTIFPIQGAYSLHEFEDTLQTEAIGQSLGGGDGVEEATLDVSENTLALGRQLV